MNQDNNQGKLQHAVASGFGAASTAEDVIKGIDLTGKVVIVTGGYAGLGLETTKTLAAAGATVIVPARDAEKAKRNLTGINNVELETMDLINQESIDAFADKFLASNRPLHILINNAGIMWVPLLHDSRGNESQLATNHLGHFYLTAKLWPALKNARGARVVNVSSWGHHFSPIVFEDPNFQHREYESLSAYGQSKTANILFSLELDNRGKEFAVRSFSLHPGAVVDSDLGRHLSDEDLKKLGVHDADGNVIYDASNGLKNLQQGASTQVWCATNPKLNGTGGLYCENTEVAELDALEEEGNGVMDRMSNLSNISGVMPYALDAENAQKFWTLSEELAGITFDVQ